MNNPIKDFERARSITNTQKRIKYLWGCAKAMTQQQRRDLYHKHKREHKKVSQDILNKLIALKAPQICIDREQHIRDNYDECDSAKALLRWGI
jgi:hypothetical protein